MAWNFPGRFLLVTFRYAIVNRKVQKSLNYWSNVSQIEGPSVNILYNVKAEVKHQIWVVFHLVYRVCRRNIFWETCYC